MQVTSFWEDVQKEPPPEGVYLFTASSLTKTILEAYSEEKPSLTPTIQTSHLGPSNRSLYLLAL